MLITNPEHKLFTLLVSSSTCSAPVPTYSYSTVEFEIRIIACIVYQIEKHLDIELEN